MIDHVCYLNARLTQTSSPYDRGFLILFSLLMDEACPKVLRFESPVLPTNPQGLIHGQSHISLIPPCQHDLRQIPARTVSPFGSSYPPPTVNKLVTDMEHLALSGRGSRKSEYYLSHGFPRSGLAQHVETAGLRRACSLANKACVEL